MVEKFRELAPGDNSSNYLAPAIAEPVIRAWQHDYFTSCLPFAQKGDQVTLPLTNAATLDVKYKTGLTSADYQYYRRAAGDALEVSANVTTFATGEMGRNGPPANLRSRVDLNDTHEVDVNEEAVTINTLRRAFRLQEWLERNARAGTRYVESLLAHFGTRSSDQR